MPTTEPQENETQVMSLFSDLLVAKGHGRLDEFLAIRRLPGTSWRTWEQITIDLHDATGQLATRESLRRWAGAYGIPDDTKRTDKGPELTYYRRKVREAGIKLPVPANH